MEESKIEQNPRKPLTIRTLLTPEEKNMIPRKNHLISLSSIDEDLRRQSNIVEDESTAQKTEKVVLQGTQREIVHPGVKPFILRSGARSGCDASLLLEIDADGTAYPVLTHWEPTDRERTFHAKTVSEAAGKATKGKRLAVLVSGTLKDVKEAEQTALYKEMAKWNGGKSPDLIFIPFDEIKNWPEIARSTLYQLVFSARTNEQGESMYEISVPGTDYRKVFNAQVLDEETREELRFVKYNN